MSLVGWRKSGTPDRMIWRYEKWLICVEKGRSPWVQNEEWECWEYMRYSSLTHALQAAYRMIKSKEKGNA